MGLPVRSHAGADEEAFAAQTASGEDQPMAPVPFDLSMLEDEPAVPVEAAAPAAVVSASAHVAEAPVANAAADAPLAPPSLPKAEKAIAAEAEKKEVAVAAVPAAPQTIRVDLDRVDRLINLVGELVINQAMLAQSVVENETGGSSAINLGLEELQQLTREIQDSVMAIRAQPVKPVFQRMGRIVREIADMTGKECAAGHRGREHGGRQDGYRQDCRTVDPHDPQRGRSRARNPGQTQRVGQEPRRRIAVDRKAPVWPDCHRDR